ncbi:MAG: DUF1667 domain-containing protein [Spirochaetes bacterium]|nr:DUF1667 domain-containing protein [Spirochaetota bacterium]
MRNSEIVCIVCPKGCRALVREKNRRVEITGTECARGAEYVRNEYIEPMRVLTTTLTVESGGKRRLSVRTDGKIKKKLLIPCVRYLKTVKAVPPIHMGEVIVENMLDTGMDLIATDEVE